ncbi:MAG: S-layer homology domain-containing protein [Phormidesmis sp.]
MTRISLTDRFWQLAVGRSLLPGLLVSLLAIAGCSGSRLGDTLGRSLEPDPQLAENEQTTDSPDEPADRAQPESPATDETAAAERNSASGNSAAERNRQARAEAEAAAGSNAATAGDYKDLSKAPEEIQPYLKDLISLDLLKVSPTAPDPTPTAPGTQPAPLPSPDEFRPNQAISRREYARWLMATNNRLYADQRSRKVRPGIASSQPVFQDVPASDPDFGAIQGLAEAGIIPSPLTGSSTALTFRPNAPLTRKDLVLWKVPLDTRQPLPQATPAAVQEAWGFQDAAKIEPRALQAILADYQNGDFANIRRAFGYTTLFQPDKAATRAEAAAILWRFGNSTEGITAEEVRNPAAKSQADETDSSTGSSPNSSAGARQND